MVGCGPALERRLATVAMATVLSFSAVASAADWPQWQGPDRNAISKETGLLKEWPTRWPAARLEDQGPRRRRQRSVCRRRADVRHEQSRRRRSRLGTLRDGWQGTLGDALGPAVQQRMPQGKRGRDARRRSMAIGSMSWAWAATWLACRSSDGKIIWQRSLTSDFGGRVPTWGYRESPLVDGDKVICTPGGARRESGGPQQVDGRHDLEEPIAREPLPAAAATGGGGRRCGGARRGRGGGVAAVSAVREQLIPRPSPSTSTGSASTCSSPSSALIGVAASDGKFLWRYDQAANRIGINCSTPLYHDGHVFASSAYGAGGGLVKLSKDARRWYQSRGSLVLQRMQNHHGGVISVRGCLYGANGGNGGGLSRLSRFQDRRGPVGRAQRAAAPKARSPLRMADSTIAPRTARMLLIEPSREEYVERGRFEQPDRSRVAGLVAPGHCQRQAVHSRPGCVVLLRHQDELSGGGRNAQLLMKGVKGV